MILLSRSTLPFDFAVRLCRSSVGDMDLFPYEASQSSPNTTEQHQLRHSFPVSEYLLWSAEVHIDFVINEFSNNVLGRLLQSFSNWQCSQLAPKIRSKRTNDPNSSDRPTICSHRFGSLRS